MLFGMAVFMGIGQVRADDPETTTRATSAAAQRLRDELLRLLQQGDLDRAVARALNAASQSQDAAVRAECVALLNSVARQSMRQDDYATADRALAAALRIAPKNDVARQMAKTVADERAESAAQLKNVAQWLELEWFEPPFRVLGRAMALSPERRDEWSADYARAAIGFGDDHYFTKNFRDAFYCYDTAIALVQAERKPISAALSARWLQSMVFALVDDVERATFSPDFWKMLMQRVNAATAAKQGDATLRLMIRGLAAEDAGHSTEANRAYFQVTGVNADQPGLHTTGDAVRKAAINRIRQLYDPGLSARRSGPWRARLTGDWRVMVAPGFRIHHHNEHAAKQVAAALDFHFDRICKLLETPRDRLVWPTPCDVWIYSDKKHFADAVNPRSRDVLALSDIRIRGGKLDSHTIHVTQSDPMLLSSTLAHELTHLIVGAATGYRSLPGALAEGAALQAEPRARQIQFARLFRGLPRRRTAEALLQVGETHPVDTAFYAESANLAARLFARSGLAPLLSLKDRPEATDVVSAFKFKDMNELEQALAAKPPEQDKPARP